MKEDVIEHALNFGIPSASKRFDVSETVVREYVTEFSNEMIVRTRCHCEREEAAVMCFMCTGGKVDISLTLAERLRKIGLNKLTYKT